MELANTLIEALEKMAVKTEQALPISQELRFQKRGGEWVIKTEGRQLEIGETHRVDRANQTSTTVVIVGPVDKESWSNGARWYSFINKIAYAASPTDFSTREKEYLAELVELDMHNKRAWTEEGTKEDVGLAKNILKKLGKG